MTELDFERILQFITSSGCLISIIWLNWTLRNLEKDYQRLAEIMLMLVEQKARRELPVPKNVFPLKFDS